VICCLISMVVITLASIRYWVNDTGIVTHGEFDYWPQIHSPNDGSNEHAIMKFIGSFTTYAFGFGAIMIVPSTRNNMKDKKGLTTAVVNSHALVTIVYCIMVVPCLLGYSESALWNGNVVDLMNDPIVKPAVNNGAYVAWGQKETDADGNHYRFANGDWARFEIPNTNGQIYPTKSWEAWVTAICTIISVSITFPLVVRILTKMGESTVPAFGKNMATKLIWRSVMVVICIALGLLLSVVLNRFNACIGLVGALFMVPIQFMIPIFMYFGIEKQLAGSFKGACKQMGIFSVLAQILVLICSLVFMALGCYSSISEFIA